MPLNPVSSNDTNYDIVPNKNVQSSQTAQNEAAPVSNSAEEELQGAELSESELGNLGNLLDANSLKLESLQKEHEQKIAELRKELEDIRAEKNNLIAELANGSKNENSDSPAVKLSRLNSKSNAVYMEIADELKNYDASLKELIQNSVSQKVENSSVLKGINSASSNSKNVDVQTSLAGYNAQKGQALAQSAHTVAGTTGWCLKGVNNSLERTYGQRLSFNGAYEAIPALQGKVQGYEKLASQFREVSVSRDELASLPAGAIVVWDKSEGHPWGHISIALGDGRESSDHIQSQMTARNADFHVFIPV